MSQVLHVVTIDGRGELIVPNAERLAVAFFQNDPSSVRPNAYDRWVSIAPRDRLVSDDVRAINATMSGRTKPEHWHHLMGDAPWLAALDPQWDLFRMPQDDWIRLNCESRLAEVLQRIVAPYRGVPLATKLLHIKRPSLIPVCDSFVLDLLGVALPEPQHPEHAVRGAKAICHFRDQGRANLAQLLEVERLLTAAGIHRSLVRIFEALLWVSHRFAWSDRKRWTMTVHYTG